MLLHTWRKCMIHSIVINLFSYIKLKINVPWIDSRSNFKGGKENSSSYCLKFLISIFVFINYILLLVGSINWDDLNSEKSYSPFRVYAQSKLANVLFSLELSKRLAGRLYHLSKNLVIDFMILKIIPFQCPNLFRDRSNNILIASWSCANWNWSAHEWGLFFLCSFNF